MTSTRPAARFASACFVALVPLGTVFGQPRTQFTALGQVQGGDKSLMHSISADGTRAAGTVVFLTSGPRAVMWERGVGYTLLNLPTGIDNNECVDISADGTVFLGRHSHEGMFRASRQVGTGPANDIGLIGSGVGVLPCAVSASGRFIVGEAEFPSRTTGFLWESKSGVFRALDGFDGEPASAYGVSADGSVVIGESTGFVNQLPVSHAAIWRNGKTAPESIPGQNMMLSRAFAVSDDGTWVVGTLGDSNARHAFRWSHETGLEILGELSGDLVGEAVGVSGDGKVVVGVSASDADERPFIWRQGHGMTELRHYLRQRSAIAANWSDLVVRAVSADGSTVCGYGSHSGFHEAFVATLGCFADYDNNGFLNGVDFDSFVRVYEQGTFRADLNADGFVTGEDFDNFVRGFLEGC